MDNKIIHYCWFGGNPLSKLAKRCIESWKKYLPDYEIKEWNESNFNINEYRFPRFMYENKKWAFVADYVRTKVLLEYGGIYFDTDMEITADVSKYLDKPLVLCAEDSKYVNIAMCILNNKDNKYFKELLVIYDSLEEECVNNLHEIAIPILMTKILEKYGYEESKYEEIQVLDNGQVYIYPREYFYPVSNDHKDNKFTSNTCMIHHFDASWISRGARFKRSLRRNHLGFIVPIINTIYHPIRCLKECMKKNK